MPRYLNDLTPEERKEFAELDKKRRETVGEEHLKVLVEFLCFIEEKLNREMIHAVIEDEAKLGNVVFVDA